MQEQCLLWSRKLEIEIIWTSAPLAVFVPSPWWATACLDEKARMSFAATETPEGNTFWDLGPQLPLPGWPGSGVSMGGS